VDGLHVYTLDGAASPHLILDVLDAYWFATPSGSLGKGKQSFTDTGVVMTATGRELWVEPALGASMQVVLDAVLTLTLGAADTATVNMPVDDRWLLNMAAAKAMDFLIRKAPGQNRGQLVQDRADFAAQVTRLAPRNQPQVDRTLEGLLDDPWDGED
jgi:hypothetical protein